MDAEKLVSVYVKIRDAKAAKTKEMEDESMMSLTFWNAVLPKAISSSFLRPTQTLCPRVSIWSLSTPSLFAVLLNNL